MSWALPALVVVEVVNAFARQQEWAIEWQWAAYWSHVATYVVGPLAAGAAAAESICYRRRGVNGLLGHGQTRIRSHGLRVMAAVVVVMGAHVIGVLTCLLAAVRVHEAFHPSLQPTIPAFIAVAAWVVVGAATGWAWPSLAAPPLLSIAGVALATIASVGLLQPYVRVDTATVGLTGMATRPAYTAVLSSWWLMVALASFWLLVRRGRGPQWGDALVAVLVIGAVVAVHWQGRQAFTRTEVAAEKVCSTSRPVLCVTPEYASRLSAYTRVLVPVSRALGRLESTAVPAQVEQNGERVSGSPPIDGVGVISITPRGRPLPFDVAWDLVEGASGCPQASTAGSAALVEDVGRLATWLARDAGLTAFSVVPPEAEITSSQQAAHVLAELRQEC